MIKHIVYPLGEKIEELLQKRIAELNLAEVVKCKDCFWFTPYTHTSRPVGTCDCDITVKSAYNEVPILEVPLDGYCSRGKRREDADND